MKKYWKLLNKGNILPENNIFETENLLIFDFKLYEEREKKRIRNIESLSFLVHRKWVFI